MAGVEEESSIELLKLMPLFAGKRKGRKDGEEFNFDRFHPYFRTSFDGCGFSSIFIILVFAITFKEALRMVGAKIF